MINLSWSKEWFIILHVDNLNPDPLSSTEITPNMKLCKICKLAKLGYISQTKFPIIKNLNDNLSDKLVFLTSKMLSNDRISYCKWIYSCDISAMCKYFWQSDCQKSNLSKTNFPSKFELQWQLTKLIKATHNSRLLRDCLQWHETDAAWIRLILHEYVLCVIFLCFLMHCVGTLLLYTAQPTFPWWLQVSWWQIDTKPLHWQPLYSIEYG